MSNNSSELLLKKLIAKTKTSSITWKKLSLADIEIKGLPPSALDETFNQTMVSVIGSLSDRSHMDVENSYVSIYNDGIFILLLYRSVISGNDIELRVQTKTSPNSKIYATTIDEKDVNLISQLKRLYNLVEASFSSRDIDSFVDDFLNQK